MRIYLKENTWSGSGILTRGLSPEQATSALIALDGAGYATVGPDDTLVWAQASPEVHPIALPTGSQKAPKQTLLDHLIHRANNADAEAS